MICMCVCIYICKIGRINFCFIYVYLCIRGEPQCISGGMKHVLSGARTSSDVEVMVVEVTPSVLLLALLDFHLL